MAQANAPFVTMPGLEALKDDCNEAAETFWRRFLKKYGRKFVQDQWLAAWKANRESCLPGRAGAMFPTVRESRNQTLIIGTAMQVVL